MDSSSSFFLSVFFSAFSAAVSGTAIPAASHDASSSAIQRKNLVLFIFRLLEGRAILSKGGGERQEREESG